MVTLSYYTADTPIQNTYFKFLIFYFNINICQL